MNRTLLLMLVSAAACLGAGCSDATGTVTGTINVDGSPLGGFEVTYISKETGSIYVGYAKGDGRYEIFGGKGRRDIPTGDYKITVDPTSFVSGVPMPKIKLPETYTNPTRTELTRTVAGGANVIDIDLPSR